MKNDRVEFKIWISWVFLVFLVVSLVVEGYGLDLYEWISNLKKIMVGKLALLLLAWA